MPVYFSAVSVNILKFGQWGSQKAEAQFSALLGRLLPMVDVITPLMKISL
jgi:hypothetical protein